MLLKYISFRFAILQLMEKQADTIVFEKGEFDMFVKELEKHESNGLDGSFLKLLFSGKDFNIKLANSLRRASMKNVPTYAFSPELITIDINTTVAFDNDVMTDRMSQVPVAGICPEIHFLSDKFWLGVNFADQSRFKHSTEAQIEFFVNVHNNSASVLNVTTNDAVVTINGEKVEPYSVEYPMLLIKLRPNDRFKCHMKGVLGVGEKNVIWDASRNSYYDNVYLDKQGNRLDFEKLDMSKVHEEQIEFTVEANNQYEEYDILIRACKYLMTKVGMWKDEFSKKIKSQQIPKSKTINFYLDKEDHTLGEILNYEFQDNEDILMSGLTKPDHLVKAVSIKVTAGGKLASPAEAMIESMTLLEKKLSHLGKIISNAKLDGKTGKPGKSIDQKPVDLKPKKKSK